MRPSFKRMSQVGRYCLRRRVKGTGTQMASSTSCEPLLHRHRSLFLSDLHLGAMGGRADLILRFLRRNEADTYILAGDILDIWHPVLPQWSETHQQVIDHLAERHQAGAKLVYVRGNHDQDPDAAPQECSLPVKATVHAIHEAADGRRYLVVHGDAQDSMLFKSNLLRRAGTWIDNALRSVDRTMYGRRHAALREPHRRSTIEWVLAQFNAMMYPNRSHERRLVEVARAQGLDGVICGHFHMPALHDEFGLVYANCGDWMDSFSAIAEDFSGRLRLMGGRTAPEIAMQPPVGAGTVQA